MTMDSPLSSDSQQRVLTQFKDEQGNEMGTSMDLPLDITVEKLQLVCNAILSSTGEGDEVVPYTFYVNGREVTTSLKKTLESATSEGEDIDTERVLDITCVPQAVYRVRAVTRCSSSIPGHSEPVISVAFSCNGKQLASGSGDTTVRFWDVLTETPLHTCSGHKHWVLCISWSPNGQRLASACKNGTVIIWEPTSGKQIGASLTGHRQWVNSLAWEPFHSNPECRRLASASKDATVRVWDVMTGRCEFVLTSHTASVTCVKWGGSGLIYTSSQDRTVKVWRSSDGVMCRSLDGHAHWVNTLALSTDYILRIGSFEPRFPDEDTTKIPIEDFRQRSLKRYNETRGAGERLVSGSDDFTLFLWKPESEKKSVSRMTGHQQLINDVKFSPDGRIICSASFDKSIKLWDGFTGKFIATLRGHVQPVYQVAFSSDSRLLVSGSADSTLKVFDVVSKKLLYDLPGHADQVFAVDWSPDGERVASGGKDKVLKIWRR